MKSASAITALLLVASTSAFAPATRRVAYQTKSAGLTRVFLAEKAKEEELAAEAVFVPPPEAVEGEDEAEEEVSLDAVEKLGRGAAKVSNIEIYFSLNQNCASVQI